MNATPQVFYNDNDPFACAWLRELIKAKLIAPGVVDERSICDIQAEELKEFTQCHFFAGIGGWSLALRLAGWPDDAPCWTGSCPCQPLSCAGQRKGHADERHLWPAFHALIAQCRPATVFGEQVTSEDGREWMSGVRADLEAIRYAVGIANLPAASIGSPQRRSRFFWVADAARFERGPHDCMDARRIRPAPESIRGFPWPLVAGRWWATTARPERLPTLVRQFNGLSRILAGYGNAIVPQVAAEFIAAFAECRMTNDEL